MNAFQDLRAGWLSLLLLYPTLRRRNFSLGWDLAADGSLMSSNLPLL